MRCTDIDTTADGSQMLLVYILYMMNLVRPIVEYFEAFLQLLPRFRLVRYLFIHLAALISGQPSESFRQQPVPRFREIVSLHIVSKAHISLNNSSP